MAVLYKLYQDNRDTSSHKGEWYARAKTLDTVTLNEIAQRIQDNTTAKKADALAVLTEMVGIEEHQEHARPLPGGCDRRQERHAPPLPLQRSNR